MENVKTRREFLGIMGVTAASVMLFTATGCGKKCEVCGKKPCECCPVCKKYPCECPEKCPVCNKPLDQCTCPPDPEKCPDCNKPLDQCTCAEVAQILAARCTGCGRCTEQGVCPQNSITKDVANRWPVVNYATCDGCGNCLLHCRDHGWSLNKHEPATKPEPAISLVKKSAAVPPTGVNPNIRVAQIRPKSGLTGCQQCNDRKCVPACQATEYKALTGETYLQYPGVDVSKCFGCGLCIEACRDFGKPQGIELVLKSSL
ncbi:MAG: hypothetical protein FWD39_00835 [Clostridiales bacterium]|nr:hypothetical protein [Clostridiales bacterium]